MTHKIEIKEIESKMLQKIFYIGEDLPNTGQDKRQKFVLLGTPQEFLNSLTPEKEEERGHLCIWCGKTYDEHEDSQPKNSVIPGVRCLLLKLNFIPMRDYTEHKTGYAVLESSPSKEEECEACEFTKIGGLCHIDLHNCEESKKMKDLVSPSKYTHTPDTSKGWEISETLKNYADGFTKLEKVIEIIERINFEAVQEEKARVRAGVKNMQTITIPDHLTMVPKSIVLSIIDNPPKE